MGNGSIQKHFVKHSAATALAAILSFTALESVAQAFDDGCDNVNGAISPTPPASQVGSFPPFYSGLSWQAGETISALVSAPTGGAATAQIEIDGSVVASAPIPGTVSYVFPADTDASYRFSTDIGLAIFELSCDAPVPVAPQPAKSIPTLSIWAIGVLSALIGLMGVFSRRGKKA